MKRIALLGVLLFLLAVCFAPGLWAQGQGTGSIEGVVKDSSGAVVQGAEISIRNAGTNATRALISDSQGHYRADLLPPGDYSVTFPHPGFAEAKIPRLSLFVGSVAHGDIQLQVAGTQQTVEVSAEAPMTGPERIAVGGSVGAIANRPLMEGGGPTSFFSPQVSHRTAPSDS